MSKTWYPVIDYGKCIECGICTDKCQHGVYDQDKAPTPVVVLPENCIHECRGCGNLCPEKAILYIGEKNLINTGVSCDCSDESGGCCG